MATLRQLIHEAHAVHDTRLDSLGRIYGFRRRWFGLEPDWSFRDRMVTYFFTIYATPHRRR